MSQKIERELQVLSNFGVIQDLIEICFAYLRIEGSSEALNFLTVLTPAGSSFSTLLSFYNDDIILVRGGFSYQITIWDINSLQIVFQGVKKIAPLQSIDLKENILVVREKLVSCLFQINRTE
jgi:hypothetical protein